MLLEEFNNNQEIIQKNAELNNANIAKQKYIVEQIEALQGLLKEEDEETE